MNISPTGGKPSKLPFLFHDDMEPHIHLSDGEKEVIRRTIWQFDNVEFTTVGIDIGSSTSHLMFSRIHLRRKTNHLSSRFVVVGRSTLWRSPILLTPFLDNDTIDTHRLEHFISDAYEQAGLARGDVDTGAVILTGEAIKRKNASAIAALFAADAGKFVCASAGHRLECMLAAHGSGAAALSRTSNQVVLNVDIGGGTTKLALCVDGEIISICAFAVGGRLVAFDDANRLVRVDQSARTAARKLGLELTLGQTVSAIDFAALVRAFCDVMLAYIRREPLDDLAESLLLTEALAGPLPAIIMFSGGVAEFIYRRESATFGDIGKAMAEYLLPSIDQLGLELHESAQGIRATAIGASQFTVQVSGKTAYLGRVDLPIYNVPVLMLPPVPAGEIDPSTVTQSISTARARLDVDDSRDIIALALQFDGSPDYGRLLALAQGIASAFADTGDAPLVLMLDRALGRVLGRLLDAQLGLQRKVICLDGIEVRDFEYVDIGLPVEPTMVVPVVVKCLLFESGARDGGTPLTWVRH